MHFNREENIHSETKTKILGSTRFVENMQFILLIEPPRRVTRWRRECETHKKGAMTDVKKNELERKDGTKI